LTASQAIVDSISSATIHVSSFSEHAVSWSLGPVDIEIVTLCKQTKPMAPRPITPTVAPPPSSLDASIPSTSYWDSANAIKLFQPRPEEPVSVCLQHWIDLLNKVKKWWNELSWRTSDETNALLIT
jgi:hypothetical protein